MTSTLFRAGLPAAMLLAAFFSGCGSITDNYVSFIKNGDPLPFFEIEMSDGETVSTFDLYGKPSLIIFFSVYCPDCHAALDEVQKLYDLHAGSVAVVPISRGESYREVSDYWAENSLTMPFSAQDDRSVYSLFASGIVPRIYVSDSSGHVVENFGDSYIPDYEELFSILFSAY